VLWEHGGWRLEFGHRYAGQLDYSAGLASTLTGHIGGATSTLIKKYKDKFLVNKNEALLFHLKMIKIEPESTWKQQWR